MSKCTLFPELLKLASMIVIPNEVTRSGKTAFVAVLVTSPKKMVLENGLGNGAGAPRKMTLGPEIAPLELYDPSTPICQSRTPLVNLSDLPPPANLASIVCVSVKKPLSKSITPPRPASNAEATAEVIGPTVKVVALTSTWLICTAFSSYVRTASTAAREWFAQIAINVPT